eukprot:953185-Rhodomonas_salina.2
MLERGRAPHHAVNFPRKRASRFCPSVTSHKRHGVTCSESALPPRCSGRCSPFLGPRALPRAAQAYQASRYLQARKRSLLADYTTRLTPRHRRFEPRGQTRAPLSRLPFCHQSRH